MPVLPRPPGQTTAWMPPSPSAALAQNSSSRNSVREDGAAPTSDVLQPPAPPSPQRPLYRPHPATRDRVASIQMILEAEAEIPARAWSVWSIGSAEKENERKKEKQNTCRMTTNQLVVAHGLFIKKPRFITTHPSPLLCSTPLPSPRTHLLLCIRHIGGYLICTMYCSVKLRFLVTAVTSSPSPP